MAQSNHYIEFSSRLKSAMGSQSNTELAKAVGASKEAVCEWIEGASSPSIVHLSNISRYLDISMDWLICGAGERARVVTETTSNVTPMLKWDELNELSANRYFAKLAKKLSSWPIHNYGPNSYALTVEDEELGPFWEKNTVFLIDPDYPLVHKKTVVFLLGGKKPACKHLIIDGTNKYLVWPKTKYNPIEITDSDIYCGTVLQSKLSYF